MEKFLLMIFLSAACSLTASSQAQDIGKSQPGETVEISGDRFRVAEIENPDIVGATFSKRFRYETWSNPKIRQLGDQYLLMQAISKGKDEFHQMVLLNSWVFGQFKKFGQPTKHSRNALEILDMIPQGATFFCVQFASTLLSSSYSVGWTARSIGLHNLLGKPGSTEHSTVEIWSNQYRKWVMFDPTFEIYIEKHGVPLNSLEIRSEWFKNGGEDLVYVKGADQQRFSKADLPISYPGTGFTVNESYPDWYSFLMFYGNADLIDRGADSGKDCFMIVDEHNKNVQWHTREVPKDLRDAYWSLGDAKMKIISKGRGFLSVQLETNTPDFDTFLLKMNGGDWKETTAEFVWPLKNGQNKLSVTTRNKAGVRGPENSVTLEHTGEGL
jgi:hypothetical protein